MCKMNKKDDQLSISMYNSSNFTGGCLEIRLFYVRISPCSLTSPDLLTLRHLRREIGVTLDINNHRVPSTDTASIALRRDHVNKDSSEVTYVTTDNVKVSGGIEFEVMDEKKLILCGSLERIDGLWGNGNRGWNMDCYMVGAVGNGGKRGGLGLFKAKFGFGLPKIEVYIAGCCSGVPTILTKVIEVSLRRKVPRHCVLEAIPENEEVGNEDSEMNGLVTQGKLQISDVEGDDYESEGKVEYSYYPDEMYIGEDGQMSWFNAGVRVGVGIGLGMCLSVGIGVGILLHSYQTTTSRFRRRFF